MRACFVNIIFLGDKYVPGALVFAQSLIEVGTVYEKVCLITPDVSTDAEKALNAVFDRVIRVPLISNTKLPPLPTIKMRQLYSAWIQHSFTKWNCLNPDILGDYDRVLLCDADFVFIENCDHLMTMNYPAATFSTPWSVPYSAGGLENFYVKYNNGCELAHNQLVPRRAIEVSRQISFICRGSAVLLKPDKVLFDTIMDLVVNGFKINRCLAGWDEQVFIDALLKLDIPVYNIHQRFNWVVGKDDWLGRGINPSTHQWYGAIKPWCLPKNDWPDLKTWYNLADNLLLTHPEVARFIPHEHSEK